jgi:hypothetical protein
LLYGFIASNITIIVPNRHWQIPHQNNFKYYRNLLSGVLLMHIDQILTTNQKAARWFNMLKEIEKQNIKAIIAQIIKTTETFNNFFNRFEVYITGSTLNLNDRRYNDIDTMVVIPSDQIKKSKDEILKIFLDSFKNEDFNSISKWEHDKRIELLGLSQLIISIEKSMEFSKAIKDSNNDFLLRNLGSQTELNRILMDPEPALEGLKMRVEGNIEDEKNQTSTELDGTSGFQLGPLVENFLQDVTSNLNQVDSMGKPRFQIQWHKSFSEGYGKTAGENNCYIYSDVNNQCAPVHLFLTTGVDEKKAMEKKESFMLEYYSEQERMRPIKLL